MPIYAVTWDYKLEGGRTATRVTTISAQNMVEAEILADTISEAYIKTLPMKVLETTVDVYRTL